MKRACRLAIVLALVLMIASPLMAEDHFFDSGGVKIRYTLDGEGPPVLLVHGYTASGDLNWRLPQIVTLLADDYRVITVDNRGHGKSDKPQEEGRYGAKMVSDAVRLLDHLGIERAHMVGYSMGGLITLKMLADHPERVLSAVVGGMGWLEAGSERAKGYATATSSTTNRALSACYRGFGEFAITRQELLSIQVPMTVLVGDQDRLLETSVKPLQEARPDIPVVLIEGAGHTGCVLKPAFREAIKTFLDRQPAKWSS